MVIVALVLGMLIGAGGFACVMLSFSKPKASEITTWLLLMLNIWLTCGIYLWGGHK